MKKNSSIKTFLQLLLILSIVSCTEPYILQTSSFESAIVIEAILTNEVKFQEVKLSRSFKLEENESDIESGAVVKVIGTDGSVYDFTEIDGVYKSVVPFQALPDVYYKLNIVTANGNNYVSNIEKLTTNTPLENITAAVAINEGVKGIEIVANSYDPSESSNYYRYTYEETFKVIVPNWSNGQLIFNDALKTVEVIPRDNPETRVCYTTTKSKEILILSTKEDLEDRVSNFPIRFIAQSDYIIMHRYSILVKQFVQSYDSFNFYKILKSFSSSDNVLSQVQPGFVYGNITCTNNPNEKVIGIFDVASVSEKRIFFSYEDIFPGEIPPLYFDTCDVREFDSSCTGSLASPCGYQGYSGLKYFYDAGTYVFYEKVGVMYRMVSPLCGDCTSFSSNVIPPFWQ